MPIPVTCTCGRSLQAPDGSQGKSAKCPHCAATLRVPSPEKTCPDCAERVKAAARICRFCRYDFEADIPTPAKAMPRPSAPRAPLPQAQTSAPGGFVELEVDRLLGESDLGPAETLAAFVFEKGLLEGYTGTYESARDQIAGYLGASAERLRLARELFYLEAAAWQQVVESRLSRPHAAEFAVAFERSLSAYLGRQKLYDSEAYFARSRTYEDPRGVGMAFSEACGKKDIAVAMLANSRFVNAARHAAAVVDRALDEL